VGPSNVESLTKVLKLAARRADRGAFEQEGSSAVLAARSDSSGYLRKYTKSYGRGRTTTKIEGGVKKCNNSRVALCLKKKSIDAGGG